MEKHYAFIKDGVVEDILVFADRNDALASTITNEKGYDSFIWLDTQPTPARWSTYDGTSFTAPTIEYLISIGIVQPVAEESSD